MMLFGIVVGAVGALFVALGYIASSRLFFPWLTKQRNKAKYGERIRDIHRREEERQQLSRRIAKLNAERRRASGAGSGNG